MCFNSISIHYEHSIFKFKVKGNTNVVSVYYQLGYSFDNHDVCNFQYRFSTNIQLSHGFGMPFKNEWFFFFTFIPYLWKIRYNEQEVPVSLLWV